MMSSQMEMNIPKPKRPKQYKDIAEMIQDKNCPDEKKLDFIAWICKLETHNGITKDELVAMLRWVVNENYDWVVPDPKPLLRVVK